jgi:ribosome biogenesis GTPase / thiamine phosphate phosphatase
MAKKPKPNKIRIEFRKNHQGRRRPNDLTQKFQQDRLDDGDMASGERVSGKGDLTRHRTVIGQHAGQSGGLSVQFDSSDASILTGRVLRVHGLECIVHTEDRGDGAEGREFRCAVRRVLKNLSTDQRHVVAAGDIVQFRPEGTNQGIILGIAPRRGVLSRTSKGRKQVLVANIDQIIIVASAAEPSLKPHLIDRFLVTAEHAGLEALICINKADLIDPAELQPLIGVYAQLGYRVLLTSVERGWNVAALKQVVAGKQSVVTGQSGVGKSSLLNAIQAGLGLRVSTVSTDNHKGRHTTTTSELIPLQAGGTIVDTPGIRQLELWDIAAAEVGGYFRELRPYANHCRFPDCTHIHEVGCAVRDAVADGRIDPRRYDSYVHLIEDPSVPD